VGHNTDRNIIGGKLEILLVEY